MNVVLPAAEVVDFAFWVSNLFRVFEIGISDFLFVCGLRPHWDFGFWTSAHRLPRTSRGSVVVVAVCSVAALGSRAAGQREAGWL